MTYVLAIGDRSHSSWSLRGWLLFDAFGIDCETVLARLYCDDFARVLAGFKPARTVPALRLPEGVAISDSLAIAEELASRHPEAGLWPEVPAHRARARALAAEMHAGFAALRDHCPMNLRTAYARCDPPFAVLTDIARIEAIWAHARTETEASGPWLCGGYCAADAFFAPVAARIAGYGLPVGPDAATYVASHLAHPAFRRWRAMGRAEGGDQPVYRRDWPQTDWPGPAPIAARALAGGPAENATCPYSGKPATHFAAVGDRVFGFCNAFCRDKTVADPAAWPAFMSLYDR